ncbi:helix-turn-helix transcriptional regulator [uncultured Arcticibacterium sp.]|uniref:helix-turn-helix domain-containing protein n=1 Tax=uncultured Arcticibacterium sp. TaxID=2173042 RepID=UPI0030F600FE
MEQKSIELNEKIKQIAEHLGYTSSRFADHTGISRPVMSHLFASRNKASLDIIQRILIKFPDLGIDWTFDGNNLDKELLNKIAKQGDLSSVLTDNTPKKSIVKIVICHTGESFTDYESAGLSEALAAREPQKDSSGEPIDKIIVFYDDKTLQEFKPA